jgi:hypothetical protein
MYGSQFHFQQATQISSLKKNEFVSQIKNDYKKTVKLTDFIKFLSMILIVAFISTALFAGSSQPRLAGGNGNANGR